MKIKNLAIAFTQNANAGLYDSLLDEEYDQALKAIECVTSLWHYKEDTDENPAKYEMNILMPLANAIEALSCQDALLRKYREDDETQGSDSVST
jgi:hypothetical protein